jgi:hypothetical protein
MFLLTIQRITVAGRKGMERFSYVRDVEAGGSNPLTPTIKFKHLGHVPA